MIAEQYRKKLRDAGLTFAQTTCLAMTVFDGMMQEEVAAALGIGRTTVQTHIDRATAKLKSAGLHVRNLTRPDDPVCFGLDAVRDSEPVCRW